MRTVAALLFLAACAWLGAELYLRLRPPALPVMAGEEGSADKQRLTGIALREEEALSFPLGALPVAASGSKLSAGGLLARLSDGEELRTERPCQYFADSDGLESLRVPESLTVRAVRELLETPPSPQAESGRLVYGSAWYYAAVVPAEAERPDLGSCRLRFLPGREWLPARLVAVSEEQDGCVALLFRLNRGGDYLRLRQCEAQWREIK